MLTIALQKSFQSFPKFSECIYSYWGQSDDIPSQLLSRGSHVPRPPMVFREKFSSSTFPGGQHVYGLDFIYILTTGLKHLNSPPPPPLSPKTCAEDGIRLACQASSWNIILQSSELPWPLCSLLSAAVKCWLLGVKFSPSSTKQPQFFLQLSTIIVAKWKLALYNCSKTEQYVRSIHCSTLCV